MTINICIAGAGRIGRIHAMNIAAHPDAHLRYVIDIDEQAAGKLAHETGASVAHISHVFDDPNVDAVVIASSTDTHLQLIQDCAQAGKAIFCEKPLELCIDKARKCIETATAASVPLHIGFNRRFDPSFHRIHDEILNQTIGKVEMIAITSRDPAPPPIEYLQRSGGLFRDMTIHDFDMARWLLPEEPVEVFATGSCLTDPAISNAGDIDTAVIILRSAAGVICHINNSRRCIYGYDQRIEVFGSSGMLRADNETKTRVECASSSGFLHEPALPFFLERYHTAYRLEIEDFLRAVKGESHELAGGEDGLKALLLADAAEQSHYCGESVTVSE